MSGIKLYYFRFKMGDEFYSWHQPVLNTRFSVELASEEERFITKFEAKPILIEKQKLAEAKNLVKWFLNSKSSN
jgi:hypothetical protein